MAAQHPIVLLELLDLPALGVSPEAIKFGSTTMESDKFIVTCETVNGQQNVVMVDLQAGNAVTRRPISAEAAIMNPVSKVRGVDIHRYRPIMACCMRVLIDIERGPFLP